MSDADAGRARRLVLTPGMGVGPELSLRALAGGTDAAVLMLGRSEPIWRENALLGLSIRRLDAPDPSALAPGELGLFEPPDQDEPCEVAAIRLATRLCLDGRADALVTGPIHKARLAARGFAYMGHTDLLGALCGAEPVMAFAGGDLRVALVTVHCPLHAVPALVTRERVAHTTRLMGLALREDLGLAAPRLAVCGLNPHAGEQGLLGREEIETIGPATEDLRLEGWDVLGPVSAETAFLEARAGRVDAVIAMYHDQGLAPLKAVDFGRSVNWTLGLPIVRTSVDHGTADALVGTGRADPASMIAALDLATRIVTRRRAAPLSPAQISDAEISAAATPAPGSRSP